MIGYHLTVDNSLCGMAMTQGTKRRVVNIGLGIKQFAVHPKGASVDAYVQSLQHKVRAFAVSNSLFIYFSKKLTALELSHISGQEDATKLRRLCITLAMKDAYIKAIGQPVGFDYSRLEFDVGNKRAFGDGHILGGWEFRVFTANLGVARGTKLVQEQYECVCAFFRGSPESTFIWHDSPKQLESWVQFINIDQMVKVLPKLSA
jgi:4'-phosphopantetheinyl transferase